MMIVKSNEWRLFDVDERFKFRSKYGEADAILSVSECKYILKHLNVCLILSFKEGKPWITVSNATKRHHMDHSDFETRMELTKEFINSTGGLSLEIQI